MKLITFLRLASDIPQFMRPVLLNLFPIPVLDRVTLLLALNECRARFEESICFLY